MSYVRIVLPSLLVILLFAAATAAGGGDRDLPGSASNPLVAVPNPTPTRIPPSEQSDPEAPRQADGTLPRPSQPSGTKTQHGTTALHLSKPMVAPPQTPRQQLEQPPSTSRPCSLVTKPQAQDLIGMPIVEPLEAPQGPTCIYQTGSGERYVTLAAQDESIERLRERLRDPTAVAVAGRSGYCGTVGGPVLYLPLSGLRTLVVAAPCEMAKGFAALAVGRL